LLAIVAPQFRSPPQSLGVAKLASTTQSTALFNIALTDQGARITTTPNAVPAIPDKSYELWIVPKGKAPISLGLVKADQSTEHPINLGLRAELRNGVTVAVTIEPVGGSPSGQPTGPIVFAGTFELAAAD
jgi:anti-sigma-K factor RskA